MVQKMKGLIFINPFLVTKQNVHQAERLKEEFNKKGIEIEIVSDGYLHVTINSDGALVDFKGIDFAIYLDKDKYLSEVLERGGLRLFNRHEAVRICDDKAQTCIALLGKGVNMPTTVFGALCYSSKSEIKPETADKIAIQTGYPVVIKESFGSLGKGVYIARDKNELLLVMEQVKLKPHLFQSYCGAKPGTDIRVIVIGGKVIASMERHNDGDFRSNIAQGGVGKAIELPNNYKKTALRCAEVLGLDYCGVDLLYGDNGEPVVCEVNSNAFFDGIEKVTGVNVAKAYVEHVIKTLSK